MKDHADVVARLAEYARELREVRASALEARQRIERAAAAVDDASLFLRDRRRRAAKAAAKRP